VSDLLPPIDVAPDEFSADRRRLDGSRTFWSSTSNHMGCTLARWDVARGAWSQRSTSRDETWINAVASDAELTIVQPTEITVYTAPDANLLLDILRPEGDGSPEDHPWPFSVDEWSYDGIPFEDGWIERWASVNGEPAYFASSVGSPIAYLTEPAVGTRLAGYSADDGWASEGSEVWEVRPGVAVAEAHMTESWWGLKGFRYEPTAAGIAGMLDDWLSYADEHMWPASAGPGITAWSELMATAVTGVEAVGDGEDDEEIDPFEYSISFSVAGEVLSELRQRFAAQTQAAAERAYDA
jgi:hypothetical protein